MDRFNLHRLLAGCAAALLLAGTSVAAKDLPAPPDVAAPPADAEVTASGLATKLLAPGTGTEHPLPQSLVLVHYSGWTTDGKLFDSSVLRGKPVRLPLDSVIDGWTEGLQLMVAGEKRRLWIPENLAYKGREDRPKGMLVFDVELLEIDNSLVPPPDVAAPPPDAEITRSGLAFKVLRPGTGDKHPTRHSTVKVRYTGWTPQGRVFDSTAFRGAPVDLPVGSVIKGWQEALQLMVPGEKVRLWIPEKLAYEGQQGKPQGMLVFDVELLSIPVRTTPADY